VHEIKYKNYIVTVEEANGILEWNYNTSYWQTGKKQKKLKPSHFVLHVLKNKRLPVEIREMMVAYHKNFFNLN
jgi:hypothetical protein